MTTALAIPQNTPKAQRVAALLQSSRLQPLIPIPEDIDHCLSSALPEGSALQPAKNVLHDRREWLTQPPITFSVPENGGPTLVSFGPPPDGLSAVERVLWPDLGATCARAAIWLYQWLKLRRYMQACDTTGVQTHELSMYRVASKVFSALYDAVEGAIRASRHAQTEDTLYSLSNGEIEATKEVLDKDGNKVTLSQGKIYDAKLVALALAAGDPARYGAASGKNGAQVTVSVVMEVPRPERAERVVDVAIADPASTPIDVDFVEA